MQEKKRSSVCIRLTETSVFLRHEDDSGSATLRGLLTMDLVKPTRVSSIEIELHCKTLTIVDAGLDAVDEHPVFYAKRALFQARDVTRRALSVGPGSCGSYEDSEDFSQGSSSNTQHDDQPSRRPTSVPPGYTRSDRRVSYAGVLDPPMYSPSPSPSLSRSTVPSNADSVSSHSVEPSSMTHEILNSLGHIFSADSYTEEKRGRSKEPRWKEFSQGTYTFPFSFSIPTDSPATLTCNDGSVTWTLEASIHKPGRFSRHMSATREINVISAPSEDDLDDAERVISNYLWRDQLQFVISTAGKAFFLGGKIPISFNLLPLSKVKVYSIDIFVRETIEYYGQFQRLLKKHPPVDVVLLSLSSKSSHKEEIPILPASLEHSGHAASNPLVQAIRTQTNETTSAVYGPGPWIFGLEPHLPPTPQLLHFTCKNHQGSAIKVSHSLHCIIRVERGGLGHVDHHKKKFYEIRVHTPIKIFSGRCSPVWASLPHYEENGSDQVILRSVRSRESSTPVSRTETMSPVSITSVMDSMEGESGVYFHESPPQLDSVVEVNALYERLMSGQENSTGEAPPAYV